MSAPSADAIKAKLSAIDATQETIVSIAQCDTAFMCRESLADMLGVMFYKRNAAQIVDIWHQCVRDGLRHLQLVPC
jgi:hypothetical protein